MTRFTPKQIYYSAHLRLSKGSVNRVTSYIFISGNNLQCTIF